KSYNRLVQKMLTILFAGYIQTITYSTYLVVFTSMPAAFKFLYLIVYLAHLAMLTLLILGCSAIANADMKFGFQLHRFYNCCLDRQIFHCSNLIQVCSIALGNGL